MAKVTADGSSAFLLCSVLSVTKLQPSTALCFQTTPSRLRSEQKLIDGLSSESVYSNFQLKLLSLEITEVGRRECEGKHELVLCVLWRGGWRGIQV